MKTPAGIVLLSGLVFMYIMLSCQPDLQAQNAPITTAATITGAVPGQPVVVPVTVTGFNNVGSVTLTLDYDYSKIHYVSNTKNPALTGFFSVGDNDLGNGFHRLILGWFGNGITLPNGSSLVNYTFTYITGSTALTWFDMGPSCEYTDDYANVLNDIPYSTYYTNGFVGPVPPLVADFTASSTYGASNASITLTDLTTGGTTGWNWSISPSTYTFINSTSATSQNPQVQFTSDGVYSVSLVASRGATTSTKVKSNYIFIGSHVFLSCPNDQTIAACQSPASVNTAYANWLASASVLCDCNYTLTNNSTGPPLACGESKVVTYTVNSDCQAPVTCTKTFTVTAAPAVVFNCATDKTEAACQSQSAIDASFASWLASASASGGCNGSFTRSPVSPAAPSACGGSTTVTWNYTSTCEGVQTCTKTFSVDPATAVTFNCASDKTETACQSQEDINASFAAWLQTTTATGGCNGSLSTIPAIPEPPSACGGSTTVTWNYTSTCEGVQTCTKTFTVDQAPSVTFSCASDKTETACQSQEDINASFAAWMLTTTAGGGCNGILSTIPAIPEPPSACGGSTTVTWNYTSACEGVQTCTKTFTVDPAPPVTFNCASDKTETACQSQEAINASFAAWLLTTTAGGGCNGSLSTVPEIPEPPSACGGSTNVTWNYTSACEGVQTCNKTFTVDPAPSVTFNCASDKTEISCQSQEAINASFAAWLLTTTAGGGCNGSLSTIPAIPEPPSACGGSSTVTWNYSSSCEGVQTCTKTFTVDPAPSVTFNCASDKTEIACQGQEAINASFAAWLLTTTAGDGCNGLLSTVPAIPEPPSACGGSTTVTWNYTSACEGVQTCTKTFTVDPAPSVTFNCASDKTETACQGQESINASFAAWLLTTTAVGGCNGLLSTVPVTPEPPSACGGSTTVTWNYTSDCEGVQTCTKTFTVDQAPSVTFNCASDKTETACQSQEATNSSFAAWLLTTTASGGCNGALTTFPAISEPPSACGGSTTVTWNYSSSCEGMQSCTRTFSVPEALEAILTCPQDYIMDLGQPQAVVDAAFASWLASVTTSGGCNTTLTNDGIAAPPAEGGTVTVTFTFTSTGCIPAVLNCSASFTVAAINSISGTLKYNNSEETPMGNISVRLQKTTIPTVDITTTTLADGSFAFANLMAGTYSITPEITMVPGDINSTDAAQANSWGTTPVTLEYVKFLSGDVIGNSWINGTDAFKIQRHFVFGDVFDNSPWSVWRKGVLINSNWDPEVKPADFSVNLNGSNVTDLDLYAMCTGDFNGSFTPGAKKSGSSLTLKHDGRILVGSEQDFELPVRVVSEVKVGAISLILEIPSDLVEVTGVDVAGSSEPVTWTVKGNELRIGWNSLVPVHITDGGELIVLHLRTTASFTAGKSIVPVLSGNPLNELANENYDGMNHAILSVDVVDNQASDMLQNNAFPFSISNYPNPFSRVTEINYSIPEDGKAILEVFSAQGTFLAKVFEDIQAAGKYSLKYDAGFLPQGTYLFRLRLVNDKLNLTKSCRFVINE